jgi:SAM-dependent methyltransferase
MKSHEDICNLCGSDESVEVFAAGVAQRNRIVRCGACGLLYASPCITDSIAEFEHYDPAFVSWAIATEPPRVHKERLQLRDYKAIRDRLSAAYPRRGRLLEIGSGFGFSLDYFRRDGWSTTGVDQSRELCAYAAEVFNQTVIPSSIAEAPLEADAFDAVIMLHVIEHVPNPLATMRKIFDALQPGGTLVLETPRYDTLMFKLLGRRERSVACDGHVYFFTVDTLSRLATTAGFAVRETYFVGRSLTLGRLLYNVGVVSRSGAVKTALESLSTKLRLDRFHLYLNLRDMQRVYLVKPLRS